MTIIGEQNFAEPEDNSSDIGELSFIFQSISRSISDLLNKHMKANQMSNQDVCNKMHISNDLLNEWLSGKHNFTIKELCKIQYYLGIEIVPSKT